jgi:hypothetical protein
MLSAVDMIARAYFPGITATCGSITAETVTDATEAPGSATGSQCAPRKLCPYWIRQHGPRNWSQRSRGMQRMELLGFIWTVPVLLMIALVTIFA